MFSLSSFYVFHFLPPAVFLRLLHPPPATSYNVQPLGGGPPLLTRSYFSLRHREEVWADSCRGHLRSSADRRRHRAAGERANHGVRPPASWEWPEGKRSHPCLEIWPTFGYVLSLQPLWSCLCWSPPTSTHSQTLLSQKAVILQHRCSHWTEYIQSQIRIFKILINWIWPTWH